ncbi:hypothetical protein GGI07_005221 [Coemansia sp. Benny D115]|nr:hypothetical protein GGI07_005221 [Coemansia sp. Benny D115]
MPVASTHDNILQKVLHDRFYSAKSAGERAILTLALKGLVDIKEQRQDAIIKIEEITRDIDITESQMRALSTLFDRYLQGLVKYSSDDARMMNVLCDKLAAQEARLRAAKAEMVDAEQRFAHLVTTWATSKF